MPFDLAKAISLLRALPSIAPEAGELIAEFAKLLAPASQATLKRALEDARARSDRLHAKVQDPPA